MFILGSQVYEDEEILPNQVNYSSIYEDDPDDYIYEMSSYEELSILFLEKMAVDSTIFS